MITKIWWRLNLGSLEDAKRLASANPLGIRTVISLCPGEIAPRAKGIQYVQIPLADSEPICQERFDFIMAAIAEGVRRGSVLVHCFAGISRAPTMCAAYMSRCGYASIDRTMAEIKRSRPSIDPSSVLLSSVRKLLSREAQHS